MIARPLLFDDHWWRSVAAAVFFPTYIFLNSILLLNVLTSIAVEAITSASEFDLSRKTLQKMELKKSLRREKLLGSKNMRRLDREWPEAAIGFPNNPNISRGRASSRPVTTA